MIVTKKKLSRIIKEEILYVLAEKKFKQSSPSNPYHDEDGRFSSYKDSKSWSLEDKKREMKSGKQAAPCGRGERRKCKKPQDLKWESTEEPRSDSTSRYRRDDPRYENDTMRTEKNFPGYKEMRRLANGIVEELLETFTDDHDLEENRASPKKCFDGPELFQLRQRIFNQLMSFISTYENAKKLTVKPK